MKQQLVFLKTMIFSKLAIGGKLAVFRLSNLTISWKCLFRLKWEVSFAEDLQTFWILEIKIMKTVVYRKKLLILSKGIFELESGKHACSNQQSCLFFAVKYRRKSGQDALKARRCAETLLAPRKSKFVLLCFEVSIGLISQSDQRVIAWWKPNVLRFGYWSECVMFGPYVFSGPKSPLPRQG